MLITLFLGFPIQYLSTEKSCHPLLRVESSNVSGIVPSSLWIRIEQRDSAAAETMEAPLFGKPIYPKIFPADIHLISRVLNKQCVASTGHI